jgi:hypothetical protein
MMKHKKEEAEPSFDVEALRADLQELKASTQEAIDADNDSGEFELLMGLIENLEEFTQGMKNPDKLDRRKKATLMAYLFFLDELSSQVEGEDFDDLEDDDLEDDDLEDEEEETEDEDVPPAKKR